MGKSSHHSHKFLRLSKKNHLDKLNNKINYVWIIKNLTKKYITMLNIRAFPEKKVNTYLISMCKFLMWIQWGQCLSLFEIHYHHNPTCVYNHILRHSNMLLLRLGALYGLEYICLCNICHPNDYICLQSNINFETTCSYNINYSSMIIK